MSKITWTGAAGDGNFDNPANWAGGVVPGVGDDAVIGIAGTVSLPNGGENFNSLATTLGVLVEFNSNSTIDGLATTSDATGTSVNAGIWDVVDGHQLVIAGTLDNSGTVLLGGSYNGDTFLVGDGTNAALDLTGGGTLLLSDFNANYIVGGLPGTTLTNTDNLIVGAGKLGDPNLSLVNLGRVEAAGSNTLRLDALTTTNKGTLLATGTIGGLEIQDAVANAGGTILAAGGVVYVESNATIVGGTLATRAGGVIETQGGNTGTLEGVVNLGTYVVGDNASVQMIGTIDNVGTIYVDGTYNGDSVYLGAAGNATTTLTGGGTVLLTDFSNNNILSGVAPETLDNVNNLIAGAGNLGDGNMTLDNTGRIDATGTAATLVLKAGSVTNTGTLEATGTAGLEIRDLVSNIGGTILAAGGNVYVESGALILGGTLATAKGSFVETQGGNTGTLDGASGTLTNLGTFVVGDDANEYMIGPVVNKGVIETFGSYNGDTILVGSGSLTTLTLTGAGTLLLSDFSGNFISSAVGGATLHNVDNLIEGGGNLGDSGLLVVNASTIDATGTASTLVLRAEAVTNTGTLEATGPAGLEIRDAVTNTGGTILAAGGNVYVESGATITGGTLKASGTSYVETQGGNTGTLDGTTGSLTTLGTFLLADDADEFLLGTLTNKGVVEIDGSYNGSVFYIGTGTTTQGTLTGGGTVLLSDFSNNDISGGVPGTTLDNLNNIIAGAGFVGDGNLAIVNAGTIDATGTASTLVLRATSVVNSKLLEATGPAGLEIRDAVANAAGTILAAGGNVYVEGGATISGGLLASTGTSVIETQAANTGTLDGASGTLTSTGTFLIADDASDFLLGTLVNKGVVETAGSYNGDNLYIGAGTASTVTLTGGGTVLLSDFSNNNISGGISGETLDNVNNIIAGAGNVGDGNLAIINAGTIDATGTGYTLVLRAASATNTALIEATGPAGLEIRDAVANEGGTILAAGGNVYVESGATISGGTLDSSGASMVETQAANNGTLDGTAGAVTNLGTFLIADDANEFLLGTLANKGLVETAGSYNGDSLYVGAGTDTTGTLTGGGTIAFTDFSNNNISGGVAGATLDNVDNTIEGGGNVGDGNLAIDNAGTIDATGTGAALILRGPTLDNTGLVEATGPAGLLIQNAAVTNDGVFLAGTSAGLSMSSSSVLSNDENGTLALGTYEALSGTVSLAGAPIVVDAADLVLSGTASVITASANGNSASIDQSLATIASSGTLAIENGRLFTPANALANAGTILLGAGTLAATLANTGLVIGTGTIDGSISDSGTIESTPGTLLVGAPVGGTGTLAIGTASVLEIASSVGAGITAAFAGATSTLRLDEVGALIPAVRTDALLPSAFAASLANVVAGITIDLPNLTATSATLSSNALTVADAGGSVVFPVISEGANERAAVSADGSGGTEVVIFNEAAPIVAPGTEAFGEHHVGDTTGISANLTVTNAVPAGAYSEKLDAHVTGATGITASGSFTGLAAGASSTALSVGISTAKAGAISGVATVSLETDGTGIAQDGDGPLALPGKTVSVTGSVFNYATLSAPGSIDLGAVRVGGTLAGALGIVNAAASGAFSEGLEVTPTASPSAFSTSGSVGDLAAGASSSALSLHLSTASSGVFTGDVTLGATSDAAGIDTLGNTVLASGTVAATGTVYQTASASLLPGTIDFGIVHVGATVANGTLAIANTATGALVDSLLGTLTIAGGGGAFSGAGSVNLASGSHAALGIGFSTATAGAYDGTADVALSSHDGQLADLGLGTGTVTLLGTVYNYATAQFGLASETGTSTVTTTGSTTVVDFGTITAGTSLGFDIDVANLAAGPYADTLSGSFSSTAGAGFGLTGFGAFSGDAAGQDALVGQVSFTAGPSGMVDEFITLDASSVDPASATALTPEILEIVGVVVPCFCPGTRIATPAGETAVEDLAIGDLVTTASGAARPVRWIGRRAYEARLAARSQALAPVRFLAGALGDGVPKRDLDVSPLHAMLIDGCLVPAGLLVNGVSILRPVPSGEIRYIHVELDSHDIILAESAPTETYVDCGNRDMFHNAGEFAARYPGEGDNRPALCAPLVEEGPILVRIRAAIDLRAGIDPAGRATTAGANLAGHADEADCLMVRGWACCPDVPDAPVTLEISDETGVLGRVVANEMRADVASAGFGDGRAGFTFRFAPPLSPFHRHVVQIRRASDGALLEGAPLVVEPTRRLDHRDRDLVERSLAALETAPRGELDATLEMLVRATDRLLAARACRRSGAEAGLRRAAFSSRWTKLLGSGETALPGTDGAPVALFIDDRTPETGRDAGSQVAVSHMRALIRLGYRVTFVPADLAADAASIGRLGALGITVCAAPFEASVEEVLRRIGNAASLVVTHRIGNAEAFGPLIRRLCPAAQHVYLAADLHFLRMERQATLHADPRLSADAAVMRRREVLAAELAAVTIVHSDVEAGLLARLAPRANIRVVGWSVATLPVVDASRCEPVIGFLGGMGHAPNLDAAAFLGLEVAPLVWKAGPETRFVIAGGAPPAALRRLGSERLTIAGAVGDLRHFYAGLVATVAPLRFGAGVKGKVLESMAAGRPVVCSAIAAEGIALPASLAGLVAGDAAGLAASILRLLDEPGLIATAARQGLATIGRDWSEAALDRALGAALGTAPADAMGQRAAG